MTYLTLLLWISITSCVFVQAQDQSGFISIDCGIPDDSSYTDEKTNMKYVSDLGFVESGASHTIVSDLQTTFLERQFQNVRSFSEGKRNCYNIKPQQGKGFKYLIRTRFMYGNYDNISRTPEFDLYLGVNLWEPVVLVNETAIVTKEIIYTLPSDHIHVCVVDKNKGTPFLSVLEVRFVKNNTYDTPYEALMLGRRWDFGTTSNLQVRYKDDFYDRIWMPYKSIMKILNTSLTIDETNHNGFRPASIVMRTAISPGNESNPLKLTWSPDDPRSKFYVYMHFAEVQKLQSNETREFDIYVNDDLLAENFRPFYLFTDTRSTSEPVGRTENEIVIRKTDLSTLPPIINAIEIYQINEFLQLPTDQQDVDTMMKIKMKYGVKKKNWQGDPCVPVYLLFHRSSTLLRFIRSMSSFSYQQINKMIKMKYGVKKKNWQGDPCVPVDYSWEGLECLHSDNNTSPQLISLNLTSSALTGEIDPAFANLTSINKLDLSNNSLTGEVPDFLTSLVNLTVLNLEGNKLIGSIPAKLLEKSKDGSLSLRYGGNPGLCQSSSCQPTTKKKKSGYIVPLVAAVLVLLVPLIVLALFCHFKRRSRRGFQVELLMRVHHTNLTSLIGYCNEDNHMSLIYEYMANGNLGDYLSGKSSLILSWEERLQISLDAAQGLEYLHYGCKPPIVHRDVKPTNILLNEKLQAKIADFGLSRSFPVEGTSQVSTVVAGTIGYLDPEYYTTRQMNEKSDVYSFGVVLLEVVTGKPAISRSRTQSVHLSDVVGSMLASGDIRGIVDQRLGGIFEAGTAWKITEIALACASESSAQRPTMSQVVMELKQSVVGRVTTDGNSHRDPVRMVTMNLDTEMVPKAR
ncbi:hypothetical protein F2Q70_00034281 [Brassica cretica]|uniref:non-specific serine/threonine protein kinase n=1 Tax=Brassica cretica TaxID=69181 RepID=A0A8S9JZH9_BRACR|nr:hypothetical protein F2Q70_00034281 [Brassica cretica]